MSPSLEIVQLAAASVSLQDGGTTELKNIYVHSFSPVFPFFIKLISKTLNFVQKIMQQKQTTKNC